MPFLATGSVGYTGQPGDGHTAATHQLREAVAAAGGLGFKRWDSSPAPTLERQPWCRQHVHVPPLVRSAAVLTIGLA